MRMQSSKKTAQHQYQHDAEICVSQVLNGGFQQLWDNYNERHGGEYHVATMLRRTAAFFQEKGREDIANIFAEAAKIDGAQLKNTPRNRHGDFDEDAYRETHEELEQEWGPLESKFYDLWESNYESDPNKRRDWETYFGADSENIDSPIFRELQKRTTTAKAARVWKAANPACPSCGKPTQPDQLKVLR
jgi:hypothetical protein